MFRALIISLLLIAPAAARADDSCELEIKQTCDDAKALADFVNQVMTQPREGQRQRIIGATADVRAEIRIKAEYLDSHNDLIAVTRRDGVTIDQLFEKIRSGQKGLACSPPVQGIIERGGKYQITYHHRDGQPMLDYVVSTCP